MSVSIDFEHNSDFYRFKRKFKYDDDYGLKNKPDTDVYLSGIKSDGSLIKFDTNAAVLLNAQLQPIGTRIFGPVLVN